MILTNTLNGYKYYIGTTSGGDRFYNIVEDDCPHCGADTIAPTGGYYDKEYIADVKLIDSKYFLEENYPALSKATVV